MYCTTDEVYAVAGISSNEISVNDVTSLILLAEEVVDRFTNTTYWNVEDSGTADAGAGDDELDDSTKSWTVDAEINEYAWIYSGTGSGQVRLITDNTATKLILDRDWTTNPDATSLYRIIHTGKNPYVSSELRDGDDSDTIFINKYPLVLLESVSSNSITITPSNIYQYDMTGKLVLNSDAEVSSWTSAKAQKNILTYWFGVYPLPLEVKRLVLVSAALASLQAQMGGTHNIPSTYSLPEGSVTIGQAYINIKGTWDTLMREKAILESRIIKYSSFA